MKVYTKAFVTKKLADIMTELNEIEGEFIREINRDYSHLDLCGVQVVLCNKILNRIHRVIGKVLEVTSDEGDDESGWDCPLHDEHQA